jgi:hypothetical protein
MSRKPCLLLFFLIGWAVSVTAARSFSDTLFPLGNFSLKTRITGVFSQFEPDLFGNVLAIRKTGQLIKYAPNGDSLAAFNDWKRYGQPRSIDAHNPLRILLFYEKYATVVGLDKLLIQRNQWNLREKNLFFTKAVANAYDNQLWVYDGTEAKIKKFNEQWRLLLESADLRLLIGESPEPVCLLQTTEQVIAYDPAVGFVFFDLYGGYQKIIRLRNWHSVGYYDGWLYGIEGKQLRLYQPGSLRDRTISLPEAWPSVQQIRLLGKSLYTLSEHSIDIYQLP